MAACDIAADAVTQANLCACPPAGAADAPPQCEGRDGPPPSCKALELAERRDLHFNWKYRLNPPGGGQRQAKLAALERGISELEGELRAAYGPGAEVEKVAFWRFRGCPLPAGGAGDRFGRKTIGREHLAAAGYTSRPLVGGSLEGKILTPAAANFVPVVCDRIAPPDLVVIFVALVLLALAAAGYRAWRRRRQKAGEADAPPAPPAGPFT